MSHIDKLWDDLVAHYGPPPEPPDDDGGDHLPDRPDGWRGLSWAELKNPCTLALIFCLISILATAATLAYGR